MNWIRKDLLPIITLLLVALLVFVPFLGNVHLFDWDEINFAESAREMIATGDYYTVQINYKPFWEKPPLFIWMQAASMHLFGINEFAARFPNAVAGFITLVALFFIGRKLYDAKFARLWCLTYIGSILPLLYFKSGIIDPWFNLFIFLSIINYAQLYYTKKSVNKNQKIFLSALFISLALLTKGPVALLMLGLVALVMFLINRFKIPFNVLQAFIFLVTLVLAGGSWFFMQIFAGNEDILKDFILYQIRLFKTQDAGHGGFLMYHWVILLFGVFPASVYALRGFATIQPNSMNQVIFKQAMVILLFTVLVVFTIVKTKIVHYSSLAYFPVTFLAAYAVYKMGNNRYRNRRWVIILATVIGFFIALSMLGLTILPLHKDLVLANITIKDTFAIGNLQANVNWNGNEWMIAVVLLIGLIIYTLLAKWNYLAAYWNIMIFTMVFALLAIYIITPKIEQYTQRAAIEFYEKKAHEDCYVTTVGFKSFAHLFYTKKKPPENPNALNKTWLLTGDVDKPVYVVSKINKKKSLKMHFPTLIILYEKNGYLFCRRNLSQ